MERKYDRNVLIFTGRNVGGFELKKEFSFTDEVITRDLTSNKKSELVVYDEHDVVEKGDILYIPNHLGITILGIIKETNQDLRTKTKKIMFNFGADIRSNAFLFYPNTRPNMVIENDYSGSNICLNVDINTTVVSDSNKYTMDKDVVIRQSMVKKPCKEIMTIEGNFEANETGIFITDSDEEVYDFDMRDNDITNKDINLATDSFNRLTIYSFIESPDIPGAISGGYVSGYIDINGGVVNTGTGDYFPPELIQIDSYEEVSEENWRDPEYLENRLLSQEYENKINFTIPITTNIKALEFNETFLSRKVRVHIGGTIINTIISGYKINNNSSIDVILGISRSRLTEQLKKYKNRRDIY